MEGFPRPLERAPLISALRQGISNPARTKPGLPGGAGQASSALQARASSLEEVRGLDGSFPSWRNYARAARLSNCSPARIP